MGPIKILVVDRRAIVNSGIALILGGYADFHVMGQAKNREEALLHFNGHSPDVVCMDIDLPGPAEGLELIRRLRETYPNTRVVILTNLAERAIIHQALKEGVLGYLLKDASADELANAIRAAHAGTPSLCTEAVKGLVKEATLPEHPELTARERQVLDLVARGLNNLQIAAELHISLSTVQFHVSHILQKLALHNRIEATAFAVRHNLVTDLQEESAVMAQ